MSLLKWALICAVLAVIFGVFGFIWIASAFALVAKILFFLFLAGFVILLLLGLFVYKEIT